MAADAFFRMGATHSICQDYAVAGDYYGRACAILSDGCSGAGERGTCDSGSGAPFTDWGARLLVLAARERLGPISEGIFSTRDVIYSAFGRAKLLEMPESALDATLLVAVETDEGGVRVFATADGVVAWRERSGRIGYESVRFARGMPRYLSYYLDPHRHSRLFEERGQTDDLLAGTMEVASNVWTPREGWGAQLLRQEPFDDGTPYWRSRYFPGKQAAQPRSEFPLVDVVALFSDGVESFQDADMRSVPLETVLLELLALKNMHGRFVTRRCTKFLDKVCAKNGWRHSDDFSMAAVAFEESESRGLDGCGLRAAGSGGEKES